MNSLLIQDPKVGTSLGNDTYKVRLAIKSKSRGKSGGAHVITYVISKDKEIYLLTIYDKGEIESIDDRTLKQIVDDLRKEE